MTVGGAAAKQLSSTNNDNNNSKSTVDLYNSYTKQHQQQQQSMIATHQRLPIHMEYLQPHITMPETKASPLALLAATCSSIGKTDAEKKDIKTTTTTPIILSKLSPSHEVKRSSFKPYKNEDRNSKSQQQQQIPQSVSMRSSPPILVSNSNIVSSKVISSPSMNSNHVRSSSAEIIYEKRANLSPLRKEYDDYAMKYHERVTKDTKDKGYKKCAVSPPLPHLPGKVSMLPHTHHHHHHNNHSDCSQCRPGRPHSGLMPSVPRSRSVQHQCSCPMCHSRVDPKCHYPNHPSMYHPSHKQASLPPPPPPVMACRDPNCTNCAAKIPNSKTLQNFVHPALVQQCTHNSPPLKSPYAPPPLPPSAQSSYESYFHNKNGGSNYPPKLPKAHVCNWVSDGKHCGNSFVTSEELYQHLRTHTSMQQQRNNDNLDTIPSNHPISISTQPGGCTIHGCPCGGGQRKSPRNGGGIPGYSYNPPSVSSGSLRYTPYSRPLSTGSGHSFPPHNLYHY